MIAHIVDERRPNILQIDFQVLNPSSRRQSNNQEKLYEWNGILHRIKWKDYDTHYNDRLIMFIVVFLYFHSQTNIKCFMNGVKRLGSLEPLEAWHNFVHTSSSRQAKIKSRHCKSLCKIFNDGFCHHRSNVIHQHCAHLLLEGPNFDPA